MFSRIFSSRQARRMTALLGIGIGAIGIAAAVAVVTPNDTPNKDAAAPAAASVSTPAQTTTAAAANATGTAAAPAAANAATPNAAASSASAARNTGETPAPLSAPPPPPPRTDADDAPVTTAAVASEGFDRYNDGRLIVYVRCEDAEAFVKSVAVSSETRTGLEFQLQMTSQRGANGWVAVRPTDKTLRFVGAGVDKTLVVPPALTFQGGYTPEPGLSAAFPVRLNFSHRLEPTQEPPRLSFTPAVPGVLAHIEDNTLILTGKFPTRSKLRVKLESDLLDTNGWTLKAGEVFEVNIPGRRARAAFDFNAGVLSPNGSLGVPLTLSNLDKVTVSVERLAPENLVPALHQTSMRDILLEETAKREITLKGAPDEVRRMFFDIRTSADKPGESPCGVRLLCLNWGRERYDYWGYTSDTAFVCVTDIALTPLLDADGRGATVWATSLTSGKPLPGVALEVRSAQNRVVARGVTAADGLARLALPGKPGESPAWVVTGRLGEDFSYVKTAAAEAPENSEGWPARKNAPSVFLYGDRGVWRGGETVRLTGIVRTADGGAMPDSPLEVRFVEASGRVFSRLLVKPIEGGFFRADFPLPADVPYGMHRAEVSIPGAAESLATLPVSVAAFEPLRLRTSLKTAAAGVPAFVSKKPIQMFAGDAPAFALLSKYRFGAPAAGLLSRANFRIEPAAFTLAAFPDFSFGRVVGKEGRVVRAAAAPLDATGARTVKPTISAKPGAWHVECDASVTEPGGRTDVAAARALWVNAPAVPGLAISGEDALSAGKEFPVRVALADALGKPAAAAEPVRVIAERIIENWTLQRDGDRYLWRRTEERAHSGEFTLAPADFRDGLAVAKFTVAAPGDYRFTALLADGAAAEISAYVSGLGETPPGAAPHRVKLQPAREAVAPGATVAVAVNAPFSGEALLTVETDRVLESRIVRLEKTAVEIPVTVPESARGSVLVSLRVVRPLDASQPAWKPVEARGSAAILVDHSARKLACAIAAPERARPGEEVEITVNVSGNQGRPVAVHCWAVDTGVLDITRYATPDAYKAFLGPKAFGVRSATTFDALLPDFANTLERIGAGDGANVFRGTGLKHRKAVAIVWNDIRTTDASGALRLKVTLPEHTGSLRWMAVAASDDRYGSGETQTTLARPLHLETSAPAFAAPGDTLRVPVAFFNNTGAPVAITPTVESADVALVTPLPQSITVSGDGKPWRGFFTVRIGENAGAADILVRATGEFPGGTVTEKLPLNIRHAGALATAAHVLALKPGETLELPAAPATMSPATTRATVTAGSGELALTGAQFASLVAYPYGCLEQTSSRILALAAAGDALGLPGCANADTAKERIDLFIRNGIAKFSINARADGGLAYWPESPNSDSLNSLLAAEAILAASERGVKTDPALVTALTGYLRKCLYGRDTRPAEQAEFCAVLAGLGSAETSRMLYLTQNADSLDADGIAPLALAWARAGDIARARALLETRGGKLFPSQKIERDSGVGSLVRDARTLAAFAAAWPESPRAGLFAATLARLSVFEMNTREQGAVISALARYAKAQPVSGGVAEVRLSDAPPPVKTAAGMVWRNLPGAVARRLTNTGTGLAFVSTDITGVSTEPRRAESRGLKISREWLDAATGTPLDMAKPLRVGQSVRVRLTLESTTGYEIPDVVLSDMLPACFEPDGSRIDTFDSDGGGAIPLWHHRNPVRRTEVREDRALVFLTANTNRFEYPVRVVAAGQFAVPAPQAVSMYSPDISALGDSSTVTVEE